VARRLASLAGMRVLFVCAGNICRSPTAEGVMRGLLAEAELDGEIEVESAGTGGWHVGDPPDPRSVAAAAERGVELSGAARQVDQADFESFDLLIAMDRSNRDALRRLAPDEEARERIRLLREYGDGQAHDVPDPYYGGSEGFAEVVEIVERNCRALLDELLGDRR
jgi:protein-tyrosine phosphatase